MILKPKKVKFGSYASLISPSGRISREKIDKSKKNIRSLGFQLKREPILENYKYLSGTDEKRLEELENSFNQNEIDTIFCIRGGFGATRILSEINYKLIEKNPKIFVGFSDITALQSAFFQKTRLVSIHGIVASSYFSDYTKKQLYDLIIEPQEEYTLPIKSISILNQGRAEGRIVGGNLSLLDALTGTEYLYKFENKIVFIEDVSEAPYKIDRKLNHLLMATDLRKAAAIVFGRFYKCEPEDFGMTKENSFTTEEIIKHYFFHSKIPIIFNLNFGHIDNSLLFPVGIRASLDTYKKQIKLLEKSVI